MNYQAEFKKFTTSQALYSGMRVALAVVIPSIILAYFGLLKEYFLFPLATSFVGLTDQVGPFVRRRNTLFVASIFFIIVAAIASLLQGLTYLIYVEIIVFSIFFSMLAVYGQRIATVGGLTLVVFSIFIDGHLAGGDFVHSMLVFSAGCIWFLLVFLVVSKLSPYKLASQLIGENYIALAEYLRLRATFYNSKDAATNLIGPVITQQSKIKHLQEETREVLFKTRQIVSESNAQSRKLMVMFLTAVDFYEKLITSNTDFNKLHENFAENKILSEIHDFLLDLAAEIENIGIGLQSGRKTPPKMDVSDELASLFEKYFNLRNSKLTADNLEKFLSLRLVLLRVKEIGDEVKSIHKKWSHEEKSIKSPSTIIDYQKFLPPEEDFNIKIFTENFSLESSHFRHSLRLMVAMVLGYAISKFEFLGIGHSYWILITIIAIIRPAYSITKSRNLLRIYGTVSGAVTAYLLLQIIDNKTALLIILFSSMILCFSLLKSKYAWAVFFMTIYIFISFNFLNPGNINVIFKDRLVDTVIAGALVYLVSVLVLPVWENTLNKPLMEKSSLANRDYFLVVMKHLLQNDVEPQQYRLKRKHAMISLANLADNFQRMLSDPKNQQERLEHVHLFVNTSYLILGYTASLSQYSQSKKLFSKIDFNQWKLKIEDQFEEINALFLKTGQIEQTSETIDEPENQLENLLKIRKSELEENEFFDKRDISKISMLTELNNITELLELLSETLAEQKRITLNYIKML